MLKFIFTPNEYFHNDEICKCYQPIEGSSEYSSDCGFIFFKQKKPKGRNFFNFFRYVRKLCKILYLNLNFCLIFRLVIISLRILWLESSSRIVSYLVPFYSEICTSRRIYCTEISYLNLKQCNNFDK